MIHRLTDPDDPRLADYRGLNDPARRSRHEVEGGFFVAEGVTVVRRVLDTTLRVRSLLVTEHRYRAVEPVDPDIPVYLVDRTVMEGVVGFDLHRGALASVDRPPERHPAEVTAGAGLVVALEGLNDHENLGAVFRTAAALGVDAVLLDPTCADPFYRRSVRVSMGAVVAMPYARSVEWLADLSRLRRTGFELVALTVGPGAIPLQRVVPAARTVLVLGAEGPGLAPATVATADRRVTIPMHAPMDSLNVGHAAAIAIHHWSGRRP